MLLRPRHLWQLRTRSLSLGAQTRVMGIVNLTPDSFSGDGLACEPERAVAQALAMLEDGADLLDLGAESTRPGSGAGSERGLSAGEEQDRLLPVLEAVRHARPDAILSVDTYHAATAAAALDAGAEIVNDVSGFLWEPELAETCAASPCGVVLMHTRGTPDDWRTQPPLPPESVIPLVQQGLAASVEAARAAGIQPSRLVLDPGYGFGKRGMANYRLLACQGELLALGLPLLAGLSRKSFLGATLAARRPGIAPPEPRERDAASAAAAVAAVLGGASIVRVHDVRLAVEAAAVADAILAAGGSE